MSAHETTTCRHCLGARCIHCNHRGYFTKRLHNPEAIRLRRLLFNEPPQPKHPNNIIAFPATPQEAA